MTALRNIKQWLSQNFLHLNEEKTEYILFSPDSPSSSFSFGPLTPQFAPTVRNLGVIFDKNLQYDKQISAVVRASFYQLRLLSKVKPFLSRADFEKVIHAFISSRIDYCNALYTGLNQSSLNRLQLVQNAAARLLTNTSKRSHITPVLRSLHWLPIRFRVEYKILLFVFKAINGLAPVYLADLVTVYQPPRTLRSSEQTYLVIPKFKYKKFGGRSFAVQGPKLWNALPTFLRSITVLGAFKSQLKTYLFRQAFNM